VVGGGGTTAVTIRNASVTAAIPTSEANGPSQGWTGKAATCLSAGVKKQSGEESGMAAGAFERARAQNSEGKRRGVSSVPRGGRRARYEQGRRRARAMRVQRLTSRAQQHGGPVGSGWVREGEAARHGADTWALQHSARGLTRFKN
jgi:hypothetical protein